MKREMVLMAVIGSALLIGGIYMTVTNSRETAQIGGLVMLICALPALMEVRFAKVESRLRKLEGKPAD